jgi:hypothetical protein
MIGSIADSACPGLVFHENSRGRHKVEKFVVTCDRGRLCSVSHGQSGDYAQMSSSSGIRRQQNVSGDHLV